MFLRSRTSTVIHSNTEALNGRRVVSENSNGTLALTHRFLSSLELALDTERSGISNLGMANEEHLKILHQGVKLWNGSDLRAIHRRS